MQFKKIKLVPSTSDYKTFAETTAKALGKWNIDIDYSKRKPDRFILKLFDL